LIHEVFLDISEELNTNINGVNESTYILSKDHSKGFIALNRINILITFKLKYMLCILREGHILIFIDTNCINAEERNDGNDYTATYY